jgi:RNA recognition motif-containing protein
MHRSDEEPPLDPDNTPPRSRLFMVVPKSADGSIIEAEMARFNGMQYCKTDLIASKGIVFVKYTTSSAACMAMESVQLSGMVAGYKVKIMLAEPKTRRVESAPPHFLPSLSSFHHQSQVSAGNNMLAPQLGGMTGISNGAAMPPISNHGLMSGASMTMHHEFASLNQGSTFKSDFSNQDIRTVNALNEASGGPSSSGAGTLLNTGDNSAAHLDMSNKALNINSRVTSIGNLNAEFIGAGGLSNLELNMGMFPSGSKMLRSSGSNQQLAYLGGNLPSEIATSTGLGLPHVQLPQQLPNFNQLQNSRLFVVVHKQVMEESLASLFRCYPGLVHVDLKRDRVTGKSKGFAYVTYMSPEAAALAQVHLNGIEYPPGMGMRLKVLFAEPPDLGRSRSEEERGGMGNVESFTTNSNNPLVGELSGPLMGTPSQDTTLTSFHMPSSPNSNESVGAPSILMNLQHTQSTRGVQQQPGSLAGPQSQYHQPRHNEEVASQQRVISQSSQGQFHMQGQHQDPQQHSARTELSTASYDSILSPHSSPLRLNRNEGALGPYGLEGNSNHGLDITMGLGVLNLGTGFAGNGRGAQQPAVSINPNGSGLVYTTSSPSPPQSRGSIGTSEASGGGGDQHSSSSWHEPSPEKKLFDTLPARHPGRISPTLKNFTHEEHVKVETLVKRQPGVVFCGVNRPMNESALMSMFQTCGKLDYVHVLPEQQVAVVKFSSESEAAAAVQSLNGKEYLGEVLSVRSSPPPVQRNSS